MKEKIKKIIKVGMVLTAAYLIGRVKGFFDTVEKYKNDIKLDKVNIGLFSANTEKLASVGCDLTIGKATDAE